MCVCMRTIILLIWHLSTSCRMFKMRFHFFALNIFNAGTYSFSRCSRSNRRLYITNRSPILINLALKRIARVDWNTVETIKTRTFTQLAAIKHWLINSILLLVPAVQTLPFHIVAFLMFYHMFSNFIFFFYFFICIQNHCTCCTSGFHFWINSTPILCACHNTSDHSIAFSLQQRSKRINSGE